MARIARIKYIAVSLGTLLRFYLSTDSIFTGNIPKKFNLILPVSHDKVFSTKPPLCI